MPKCPKHPRQSLSGRHQFCPLCSRRSAQSKGWGTSGRRYKKKRSRNRSAKNPRVDARSRRALVPAQVPAQVSKKRKLGNVAPLAPKGAAMDVDSESDSDSDDVMPATCATGATPATPAKPVEHNTPATPATPAEPPAQSTCCNNCDYIFNNLLKRQLDSAKCSVHDRERHFLQTEMETEIEAEDGTASNRPTKESGYTGLPHDNMCLHGDACTNNEFDVGVPLHACYFCPASECARCAGLSIRQVRLKNPLDFVCSQCVDEARKNARVFVG